MEQTIAIPGWERKHNSKPPKIDKGNLKCYDHDEIVHVKSQITHYHNLSHFDLILAIGNIFCPKPSNETNQDILVLNSKNETKMHIFYSVSKFL